MPSSCCFFRFAKKASPELDIDQNKTAKPLAYKASGVKIRVIGQSSFPKIRDRVWCGLVLAETESCSGHLAGISGFRTFSKRLQKEPLKNVTTF
jgi:hypothetical protein